MSEPVDFLTSVNSEANELMGMGLTALRCEPSDRRGRGVIGRAGRFSRQAVRAFVVAAVICALVIGLASAYYILRQTGRSALTSHIELAAPSDAAAPVADEGETIVYNGVTYCRRASVLNLLCLGVDRTEAALASGPDGACGEQGQADTIFLAALDTEAGTLRLLNLSRDTMAAVDVYNTDGEYVSTDTMQLCLAYAYGGDDDEGCLNVAKSVSRLLYGLPVDAYIALDLSAVSVLNDAIGGVEVDVLEDLSDRDPSLTEGAHVLLKGNLAEIYVRSRNYGLLEANSLRMARQRQYVTAFFAAASAAVSEDVTVALTLYRAARSCLRTSLGLSELLYLASLASDVGFTADDIVTAAGTLEQDGDYARFTIDEDALLAAIADIYYEPLEA